MMSKVDGRVVLATARTWHKANQLFIVYGSCAMYILLMEEILHHLGCIKTLLMKWD